MTNVKRSELDNVLRRLAEMAVIDDTDVQSIVTDFENEEWEIVDG